MALDLTKVFKGIQQVKALPATPEKGVIYFVRHHGEDGNPTGNASIYFGGRLYGNVETTRLAQIESDILALDGRVDAIEAALGTWESQLGTVAGVVKAHNDKLSGIDTTVAEAINSAVSGKVDSSTVTALAGRVTTAESEIDALQASLGENGDTTKAIAAAEAAAKAHAEEKASAAETAAKAHAETKASEAQSAAQAYADGKFQVAGNYEVAGTAQGLIDALSGSDDDTDHGVKVTVVSSKGVVTSVDVEVTGELSEFEDGDKKKWDEHVADEDIHVTKAQKDSWTAAAKDVEDFFKGALEDGAEQVKDTLREIQDYINSDATAAATMAENITKAQNAADKAQGEVDALELVVGTKAAQSDLNALAGRVTTAEGEIDALQASLVEGGATAQAIAAAQSAADKAQGEVDALELVVGTKAEDEKAATGIFAEIARVEGIADAARTESEVNAQIDAKIAGLNSASHTHDNKDVLDNIRYYEAEKIGNVDETSLRDTVLSASAVKTYVDAAVSAIDHRLYYGGDDAE